jgi:hypothetical protein
VRELDLLGKTADQGILSKLEAQGLSLEKIEQILPALEKAGALSLVGNNQQLLVNGLAPVVIEGAPILLPLVSAAIGAGPSAFFAAAATSGAIEFYLLANNVEIPLIGLPAGVLFGLLLVPLTLASAGAGIALASLKD